MGNKLVKIVKFCSMPSRYLLFSPEGEQLEIARTDAKGVLCGCTFVQEPRNKLQRAAA